MRDQARTVELRCLIVKQNKANGCTCKSKVNVTWLDNLSSFVVVEHQSDCPMEIQDA